MIRSFLIGLFILTTTFASAQDVEFLARDVMKRNGIPEMGIAVVKKDSILYKNVFGHHKLSEINSAANAQIDDYFHLGSLTKAITSFIAGYLVDQNKIKWDAKFFEVIPEMKDQANPAYWNVTLEDLLSHRARVQQFVDIEEFGIVPKFEGNKQVKRWQFVQFITTLEPVKEDEVYTYSNAGYSMAAVMLEKVSGKTWEQLVEEIMIQKLGLKVAFGWPSRNFENQPYGHYQEGDVIMETNPSMDYDLSMVEPAGDLSMTIGSYAKFIQLHLQGWSGENNILNAAIYKHLLTARDAYALGWINKTTTNDEANVHAGSDGTFFSFTYIDRKKGIAYIIFTNNGSEKAQKGVAEMLKFLRNSYRSE